MKNILITGSSGMIGSDFVSRYSSQYNFIKVSQEQGADITNIETLKPFFDQKIDFVLHYAAYTQVDKAETEKDLCYKINVNGTQNLFQLASVQNAKFVLVSTDYVFDGQKGVAYTEDIAPNPLGIYGKSKHEAEQVVERSGAVVRITTPYCVSFAPKKDLARTLIALLKSGKPLPMVEDNLFVPTFIPDINAAIAHICDNFVPQIYHAVPEAAYSAYEVGQIIASNLGVSPDLVQRTTFDAFSRGKAPRPQYSKLTNTRNFGFTMQNFEDGIKLLLK